MTHQPVLLIILDGWGLRKEPLGNAITQAQPTFYHHLLATRPNIAIQASGEAVGLPEGQMGNSEVGHLNIGAGRIVYQELTRIDKSIREGDFFHNAELRKAVSHAKTHGSTLHVMGLISDGGVHSSMGHLLALLKLAKQEGLESVRVHGFLDGRDVPPQSAEPFLDIVEAQLIELGYPQMATISGRYFAMDRDKRWDRVQQAYDNLTGATGVRTLNSIDALKLAYRQDKTDEFVPPSVCDITFEGMQDNDSVIFFNFRPDRARELTQAFVLPEFTGFERARKPQNLHFVTMTMYDETLTTPVAYPKVPLTGLLVEALSKAGVKQFRTAETEKYAHVTYFFNGGFEKPYAGEDRALVNSPKVATYDMQPEMSLPEVTQVLLKTLESKEYGFIATNFANPDMVGHTGVMDAAVKAVQAVDHGLKTVVEAALSHGYVVMVTADHGNIEMMIAEDGGPHTAHTTDLVPFILIDPQEKMGLTPQGDFALCNIAPTVLDIMGIKPPKEMTAPSMRGPVTSPLTVG